MDTTIITLGYSICIIAVLPIFIDLIKSQRICLDSPLLIPFGIVALFIGYRAIYVVTNQEFGLYQFLTNQTAPNEDFLQVTVFTFSCMVTMLIGYYITVKPNKITHGVSFQESKIRNEGIANLSLPFVIGIVILSQLYAQYGIRLLSTRGYQGLSGYVYLGEYLQIGALVLLSSYCLSKIPYKSRANIFNFYYLIIFIAFYLYLYFGFSTQGRFKLVAPVVALAVLLMRVSPTSKTLKAVLCVGLLGGFVLFSVAGAFRQIYEKELAINFETILTETVSRSTSAEDYNGLEGMAFVMNVFGEKGVPFLYGKSYVSVFWHWIPRNLFDWFGLEKPLSLGTHMAGKFLTGQTDFFAEKLDRKQTLGFSPTFLGQNYENFGFIGGIILAFFQGCGLAWVYNYANKYSYSANIQSLYACFIASLPGLARGGTIAIDLANAGMAFLPVFGVIIIFKIFVGGKSLMTHLQSPVNQPNQVQGPSGNPPAHRPQMGRVPFRGISMVRPSNPPPPQRPPQP